MAATYTARGGTIRYMAPEQFVTGQSSVQSDVWALGVILYELASGRHPFARPDAEDFQAIRAIQFSNPDRPQRNRPTIPPELKSVIATCLEKNPGARYNTAAEVREALKTIMKTLQIETGIIPGDAAAILPTTGVEAEKRNTGFLSMLAERFRESASERAAAEFPRRVAVYESWSDRCGSALWIRAGRCDRCAFGAHSHTRCASVKHADVAAHRANGSSVGRPAIARLLRSCRQFCALGTRLRSELATARCGFAKRALRRSNPRGLARSDRGADARFQTKSLPRCMGSAAPTESKLRIPKRHARRLREASLPGPVSEEYLQARALLSSFMVRTGSRADLDRACALFTSVTEKDPEFAAGMVRPGHCRAAICAPRLRRPDSRDARAPRL